MPNTVGPLSDPFTGEFSVLPGALGPNSVDKPRGKRGGALCPLPLVRESFVGDLSEGDER